MRQIRAFVAVAEEGSFTLAARKIRVTQSAVSHSMRALEDQLGCKLLDRSCKHVSVTQEGEILLKRCRRLLDELEQAVRELDGLRRWGQTRLRIGAPQSLCHFLIPGVLREFRDAFPCCEPRIEAGETGSLLERLAASELDLVVGMKPQGRAGDAFRLLFRDRLAFVVSPLHPWAGAGVAGPVNLRNQQLIIHAGANETRRRIDEWLVLQKADECKPLELGEIQAIKEMARLGMGVGIVAPWVAAREIAEGSLAVVPLENPSIEREWGAFHSPRRTPTLVEETFVGLCEMAFSALNRC